MRNLLEGKRLHYRIWTNAPEGAMATRCTSLEQFADMLPHGSGFDRGWSVEVRPRGRGLTLRTEWHAMSEHGYYVGWFPVMIWLTRDENDKLYVSGVRVNNRLTNDAGDYIADVLHDVCRQANGEAS